MVKAVYPEWKPPPAKVPTFNNWTRGPKSVSQIVREMAFQTNPDPEYVRLHRSFTCEWCAIPVQDRWMNEHDTKTYDHKHVFSQGGGHEAENLRVSCMLCNNVRGAMSEDKFEPIACEAIRPIRPNLRGIAVALAERNLIAQARTVLTFAGVTPVEATTIIYENAAGGFDFSSKKMFGRAVQHVVGQIKHHYEAMGTDDLIEIYKNYPVQPFKENPTYDAVEMAAVSKIVREILLERSQRLKVLLYVGFQTAEE